MFIEFDFKMIKNEKNGNLKGYHWSVENPEHVVVLIHGIGEYAGRYDRLAKLFNEKDIAVISMDLRGHGKSFGKRGHTAPREEILKDIDDLIIYALDKYPGIPLILYGHSMGGNMVLDYRVRGLLANRPSGFIVTAPWARLVKPLSKPLALAALILSKVAPSTTFESKIDASVLGNPQSVGEYKRDPLVHGKISAETAQDGFTTGKLLEDGKLCGPFLGKGKPMLLLHGKEDRLCSIEGTKGIASHEDPNLTKYLELEGIYHEVHNGGMESDGTEVILKIRDFIGSIK
jgi:acylglycerol lipase